MSISKPVNNIEEIIDKAETGNELNRHEIVLLLAASDEETRLLYAAANSVRKQNTGDEIFLRGIIEFSNYCERNCLYCGLRRSNKKLSRYRMPEDEIIATARLIKETRIPTVVLQSGEDSFYTSEVICRVIERIKTETGLIITLSIGEKNDADYRDFRQAGASRYLLKHETSSKEIYNYLRPGCLLEQRLRCLQALKKLGFETGTGNMVGLPGQTPEILADDLLLMKKLDADMLGIGPFIAHPDTPLNGLTNYGLETTLRVLAIARLLTRNTNIPATTALGSLHPRGRIQALQAGANVVMPDFTPEIYKSRYDIYPGRTDVGSATEIMENLQKDFASIGRPLNFSAGYRQHKLAS